MWNIHTYTKLNTHEEWKPKWSYLLRWKQNKKNRRMKFGGKTWEKWLKSIVRFFYYIYYIENILYIFKMVKREKKNKKKKKIFS